MPRTDSGRQTTVYRLRHVADLSSSVREKCRSSDHFEVHDTLVGGRPALSVVTVTVGPRSWHMRRSGR
jgi:hypothetical protein